MAFSGNCAQLVIVHKYYFKEDHRSYIRTMQVRKESLKKFRLVRDFNPWPIQRPAPTWLVSLFRRALHEYGSQEFETRTTWIFFRLSFRNCISCVYNCDDLPSNNSSLLSSHTWFSSIHNIFTYIFINLCPVFFRWIVIYPVDQSYLFRWKKFLGIGRKCRWAVDGKVRVDFF